MLHQICEISDFMKSATLLPKYIVLPIVSNQQNPFKKIIKYNSI